MPVREKKKQFGFRPCLTKTGPYSHRRWYEAGNSVFRKKRNCTVRVAKTKAPMSFAVTAKLICASVFAYADCWFSHTAAHISFCFGIHQSTDAISVLIRLFMIN